MKGANFTPELFAEICRRIADGESLNAICREKAMPAKSSFFDWLAADAGKGGLLTAQYQRAREAQADAFFDEIVMIADTCDDPAKARVQIDARKWAAGKMRPKVYGDKMDLTHSAPDGGPLTFTWRNASD